MMKSKTLALCAVMLWPLLALCGVPDMKFLRLDTRDGLSNSNIKTLMRDTKGFVWIGTPYGLNRYDGYRFRTFYSDAKDTMTLRNNYVDEIMEAYDGKLWLRQGMNYSMFDPVTERGHRHPEYILQQMGMKGGIERMYIDRDRHFWVKTYEDGFWHINPKTKQARCFRFGFGAQDFNADVAVSDFVEDDRSLYVSSTNGEVLCFDKRTDRILWKNGHLRQQQRVSDQDCKPRLDHEGNLWLITTVSTYIYNHRTGHWFYSVLDALRAWGYEGVPDEISLWDMNQDKEGRYWLATDHGGLFVADPKDKELRQFLNDKLDESTISDNTLRVVYRDQLDRMWIGTYMNGVNLYTGSVQSFNNLELGNINTVCADRQGYWWLGTNDKGIIRYNPRTEEQVSYTRENSGFRSNTMVGSMVARDGSVWFGTYEGGLIHIKDGHVTNITATGDTLGLNSNNIWTICEDQWGNMWLGELGGGIQRVDKRTGRMRSVRMSNSVIPSDYINAITRTRKGWLLAAHSKYFTLVNPKTFEVKNINAANNPEGIPITEISICGMEDSRGLIWQGSSSGATIWDMKHRHAYLIDMKSGLFGSTVNGLIEDNKHTIWLATDHGVTNIIPQEQDDGLWHFVVRSYNNRDGLQDGPYNQRSMCYTHDGLILVGGQGGLDIINPDNINKGRNNERPLFSGLQIFDQDVYVGQEVDGRVFLDESLDDCRSVTLRYNDQFTIQLGSSSGEIHNRSRFVYRLEGFNEHWVRTSEQNPNITYNSLSPGDYVLHVRMLNDDGTFGEEESLLDITILPPLWRRWWMLLLYMVLLGSVVWRSRQWYIRHHEQRMAAETLRRETEKRQWMNEMRMQLAAERAAAQQGGGRQAEPEPVAEHKVIVLHCESRDLVTTVGNICKEFSVTPEGLKAKVSFVSLVKELPVSIDRGQLAEALNILLGNSVKFSPGNCRITVNVGRGGDSAAVIQVADNGIGIRDEYKATAFAPILSGDGIGLDHVHDIVVAHGGTIRLADNPGGGTVFTITLPAEPDIQVEEAVMLDDDA